VERYSSGNNEIPRRAMVLKMEKQLGQFHSGPGRRHNRCSASKSNVPWVSCALWLHKILKAVQREKGTRLKRSKRYIFPFSVSPFTLFLHLSSNQPINFCLALKCWRAFPLLCCVSIFHRSFFIHFISFP
jgi:hypothetical protein